MRLIAYETADCPPWLVWNRYGRRTIGAAVRIGHRRLLSLVWRRA